MGDQAIITHPFSAGHTNTMNSPSRPYQGASAQARIQQRRQQLLDIGFEAMSSDEWRSMSINQLCRLAGLNKRYFYESFASLDDVATAVTEDLSSKVIYIAFTTANEGTQAKLSSLEISQQVMKAVVEYLTHDPRRARVLFGEVADNPVAKANRRRVINNLAVAVSSYGHVHYEAGEKTDPIASLVSSMLVGGTIEAILNWLDGGIEMSRDQFIADLAVLWNINGDSAAEIGRKRN